MRPYFEDTAAGITIYHGNALEIAPSLGRGFALVSDPPYGMAFDTDMTRFSGGSFGAKRGRAWPAVVGDDVPFNPTAWLDYPVVVLFGANHYAQRLPVGSWLVWVKKPVERYGTFLSDAEIAWASGGYGVYVRHIPWEGCATKRGENQSLHPVQKPIEVMAWALERNADSLPVLDPFMGSGTTLVAAQKAGLKAIGIEIEERYCEIAAERLSQGVLDLSGGSRG